MFGVGIMLVLGIIAYILEARRFAIAPIILGIVLGPLVETNFTTSMIITSGNFAGFFGRPIAGVLGAATIIIWGLAIFGTVRRMRNERAPRGKPASSASDEAFRDN
jgi:TctA family transporter